jgi:hypothetical protein
MVMIRFVVAGVVVVAVLGVRSRWGCSLCEAYMLSVVGVAFVKRQSALHAWADWIL